MRPIKPLSCYSKKHYILVVIEYDTKWIEALATKINDAKIVAKFIYEYIIICFDCPKEWLVIGVLILLILLLNI